MSPGPKGYGVTQNLGFSHSIHADHLLLVTFYDTSAVIEGSFRTHGRTEDDERTDRPIEVKMVGSYLDCIPKEGL